MADNSYPKNFRLLSASDFNYLKRGASSFKHRHFRIFYKSSRTSSSKNSRLGIAVSKKVGKAHDRNLCKRVVREQFRKSSLKDDCSIDLLVTISPFFFKNTVNHKKELADSIDFAFSQLVKFSKDSLT